MFVVLHRHKDGGSPLLLLSQPPSGKPPPPKDAAVSAAAADLIGGSSDPSFSSLPPAVDGDASSSTAAEPAPTPAFAPAQKSGPAFAPASASLLAAGSSWGAKPPPPSPRAPSPSVAAELKLGAEGEEEDEQLAREVEKVSLAVESEKPASSAADDESEAPNSEAGPSSTAGGYPASFAPEDPTDELDDSHSEDDEETGGEWITPANVNKFKARDLGLALPESSSARGNNLQPKKPRAVMKSACMTSDFAVQNVLLQMGLNLVGGEGRRIRSVRSWVLRCHACFKCVTMRVPASPLSQLIRFASSLGSAKTRRRSSARRVARRRCSACL